MSRERKEFVRKSGLRDAKLYVVATEGEKCERRYFEELASEDYFYNSRVHVEVLVSIDGRSSPRDVIKLLDKFKKEYRIREDDELWLVIDRDKQSWGIEQIKEVAQSSNQKGYYFGLSNPCFELWILLHLTEIKEYSESQKKDLFENKKVNKNRTKLESEIIRLNGSYNKSNPDLAKIIPNVQNAIEQAKQIDQYPNKRWIDYLGTKIYQLVEKII